MKCNTYIDEAGNTGYDIWSFRDQPFFVLAGVTIDENSSNIAKYVENVFNSHKQPKQKEIKTHKWLTSSKGRQCILDMSRYIYDNAIDVNVVVVEKRFMIAGLIVYKFFDGAYNDFNDYTWVNDDEERFKAANYYYDLLSDVELGEIGYWLMHPTEENTQAIWNMLWVKTDEPEYKRVLVGVEDHLDKINEEFSAFISEDNGLHETMTNSPNFTAFSRLGNMIAMSAMRNEYTTRMIFDNSTSCNNEFEYIVNLFQGVTIPDDFYTQLGISSWKNRVTEFLMGDSKQDYNIQAADVVASLVYYVYKNVQSNKIPHDFDKSMMGEFWTMIGDGRIWNVTSNKFLTQLMSCN